MYDFLIQSASGYTKSVFLKVIGTIDGVYNMDFMLLTLLECEFNAFGIGDSMVQNGYTFEYLLWSISSQ